MVETTTPLSTLTQKIEKKVKPRLKYCAEPTLVNLEENLARAAGLSTNGDVSFAFSAPTLKALDAALISGENAFTPKMTSNTRLAAKDAILRDVAREFHHRSAEFERAQIPSLPRHLEISITNQITGFFQSSSSLHPLK